MSSPVHDHDDAVSFLQWLHPEDRILLNTIRVTGGAGDLHQTFRADDPDGIREFLAKTEGDELNVYFSVNPPRADMRKKAGRSSIARLSFLHVDLDPRAGEDIEAERGRLLRLLTVNRPDGVPAPSAIVDSGGGFWGFWRLDEPLEIDGDEQAYEEAKLYNLQLELLFGADSCHNVDRIARLPGTVNWPDVRKRKKGRTAQLAKTIEMNDAVYSLSDFTKAPQLQATQPAPGRRFESGAAQHVEIDENVRRVIDLNDLGQNVNDFCKVVIAQGFHPDEPDRWAEEGRSGALWYVVCELVRSGVDDNTIYSIITDPEWAISESVLDGSNGRPERYAKRQIGRAHEFAEPDGDELAEMNARYAAVLNAGNGKVRVVFDDVEAGRIVYHTMNDFVGFHQHRQIEVPAAKEGQTKLISLGRWWLTHPKRRSYTSIVFSPGREVAPDRFNLWQGFAYNALPEGSCQFYLTHVRENICNGDSSLYNYVLDWMANAVQHPDQPAHTALVMRGSQGAGKGTFAKHFGALFGAHFKQVTDAKHLVGSFNYHLRDCVVLFADEAVAAGNKQHESTLKSLVTEESIIIEAKGVDASVEQNYLHIILASNDDWVVPAGADDRRFVVLDVSKEKAQDGAYFGRIAEQMNEGGYEALLHLLLSRDIRDFDPRKRPETAALADQKAHSFDPLTSWWFSVLQRGMVDDVALNRTTNIPTGALTYEANCETPNHQRFTAFNMNRLLEKVAPSIRKAQVPNPDLASVHPTTGVPRPAEKPFCYVVPRLSTLRAEFDATMGGPFEWDTPDWLKDGAELPDCDLPNHRDGEAF